ncbi:MAG: phytanoyl-CoA dioxygenase family protein [Gammaproteobacteria bacterium]|nr:phytanoyl-CoA dioxygenase family protein [Gammaproteobacteria bacterium]
MAVDKEWLAAAIREINTRGYTEIAGFLSPRILAEVESALAKQLGTFQGRNNFEGTRTERVYTLVGRDKVFQEVVEDARVMALCEEFLAPNFLLTASQAISISPGETPQPFHTDDSFYPLPRPRPMVSLSTIVAVDAFTLANGGTQVIPASHLWDEEKLQGEYGTGFGELDQDLESRLAEKAVTVEMAAGSCVVFAGTLLHRGGANNSDQARCAFSNQYCQPWARTQENFFLAIPPEKVRQMSPRVQELLGYSIHPPFMGQLSASHPKKALEPGYVPPVMR